MYYLKKKDKNVAKFNMNVYPGGITVSDIEILNKRLLPLPMKNGISLSDFLMSRCIPYDRINGDCLLQAIFEGVDKNRGRMGDLAFEAASLSGFMSGFDSYYVSPEDSTLCIYGDIPIEILFEIKPRKYIKENNDPFADIIKNGDTHINDYEKVYASKSLTIPSKCPSYWENGLLKQKLPYDKNTIDNIIKEISDYVSSEYEITNDIVNIKIPRKDFYFIGMPEIIHNDRYKKIKEIEKKYNIPLLIGYNKKDIVVIF